MRKLIRDNKVGVILGIWRPWYSTHQSKELLYLPELVELIESNDYRSNIYRANNLKRDSFNMVRKLLINLGYSPLDEEPIDPYMRGAYLHGFNISGALNLAVAWIPKGTEFLIYLDEYENREHLIIIDKVFTA